METKAFARKTRSSGDALLYAGSVGAMTSFHVSSSAAETIKELQMPLSSCSCCSSVRAEPAASISGKTGMQPATDKRMTQR